MYGDKPTVTFWCPGCHEAHAVTHGSGGWTWNGDAQHPTFTPSVLVTGLNLIYDENGQWTGDYEKDANGDFVPKLCHSFVTDGQIQFLGDSTHALAGQTVPLPAKWTS